MILKVRLYNYSVHFIGIKITKSLEDLDIAIVLKSKTDTLKIYLFQNEHQLALDLSYVERKVCKTKFIRLCNDKCNDIA